MRSFCFYLRSSAFICGFILMMSQCFAAEPQFTISYWCGPPGRFTTLETYKTVKDANFTLAFPSCSGATIETNRQMLDICQKAGLKAVVSDGRMPYSIDGKAENRAKIDAIIKDYSGHPALFGYFIVDEPGAGSFKGLAEVVAYLKEKDPKHPGFINLLPTYGRDFNVLGTPTYTDYVNDFAKTVKPFAISYDHYNLTYNGDREDFFENLETVRKASLAARIPFWNIVLAVQHFAYRNLNEAEIRFEAMQTLAFGAHGLLWFTYWSPAEADKSVNWQHAMINADGTKDAHYDMIRKVNADVLAIGNELVKCRSIEVYQPGKPVTTRPSIAKFSPATQPSDFSPIKVLNNADLTVGVFSSPNGKHLALVANRDYKSESAVRATVQPANAPIEMFDAAAKSWSAAPIRERSVVELTLPPCGATLLRW